MDIHIASIDVMWYNEQSDKPVTVCQALFEKKSNIFSENKWHNNKAEKQ